MSTNGQTILTLESGVRDLRSVFGKEPIKYGDKIIPGTQIRIEGKGGNDAFALFRRWARNSKPHKSKLVVHPLNTPLEHEIKVNPHYTRCFIAS